MGSTAESCCDGLLIGEALGIEQARMAVTKDLLLISTGTKVPLNFISSVTVGRKVTGGLAERG